MTDKQPGLIDEPGRQRVSDSFFKVMVECSDNHAEGCTCRWDGEVTLPEIVIEDHDGYLVVADRG